MNPTGVGVLGMFAKYWQPGQVKTRLAQTLGGERAARIHKAFVAASLERFSGLADERLVAVAPPRTAPEFHPLTKEAWAVVGQSDGSLGDRMRAFVTEPVAHGKRVVLIGSDSPDLPVEYVLQAFEALKNHEVVLGPASDGGYYLVGCRGTVPPIFADIAWSTSRVWEQTITRLHMADIQYHTLPMWHDVDDLAGLEAMLARLGQAAFLEPPLAALRATLLALLER